jgi:hypothetical protein
MTSADLLPIAVRDYDLRPTDEAPDGLHEQYRLTIRWGGTKNFSSIDIRHTDLNQLSDEWISRLRFFARVKKIAPTLSAEAADKWTRPDALPMVSLFNGPTGNLGKASGIEVTLEKSEARYAILTTFKACDAVLLANEFLTKSLLWDITHFLLLKAKTN